MKKMVPNKTDSKMGATTPHRSTRIMEKLQGSPAIRNALASRIKRIEEEKAQSSMHGSGLDKPPTTGPDHPEELPALARIPADTTCPPRQQQDTGKIISAAAIRHRCYTCEASALRECQPKGTEGSKEKD